MAPAMGFLRTVAALVLLIPGMLPALADAPTCPAAAADLEKFLQALPRSCRKDSDCEGYFYRADSCARAVVMRKGQLSPEREKRLLALQSKVRQACAAEFAIRPACSPQPFRAECRRNTCVDVLAGKAPGPPTVKKRNPAYPVATIRHACGPTDGAALQIILSKAPDPGAQDARIFLTIYGDLPDPPLSEPRTYRLDPQTSGDGVRCPKPNACETAERGTLVLDTFSGHGSTGSYKLYFKDGSVEEGSFQAAWKDVPQQCG